MSPNDDSPDEERPSSDPPTTRDRPSTDSRYGIPTDGEGPLDWGFVVDRLTNDRHFWVATMRPNGRPHTRPVWGVFVDGTFHCGGGERTRWVRNLESEPAITVHTEDAESVVILEGIAEKLTAETTDADRLERIDDAYEEKYGIRHSTPVFAVQPTRVLAWRDFPTDATRWLFDADEE